MNNILVQQGKTSNTMQSHITTYSNNITQLKITIFNSLYLRIVWPGCSSNHAPVHDGKNAGSRSGVGCHKSSESEFSCIHVHVHAGTTVLAHCVVIPCTLTANLHTCTCICITQILHTVEGNDFTCSGMLTHNVCTIMCLC